MILTRSELISWFLFLSRLVLSSMFVVAALVDVAFVAINEVRQ